jgi:class 3 adenylate cyclase
MASSVHDVVQAGIEALRRHAWDEAFELLTRADATMRLDGPGLEHLAEAASWTIKPHEQRDALERAYSAYMNAGNRRRASYMALEISSNYNSHGQPAVARGWMARAERLLASEPDCVERGYLLLRRARRAYDSGDPHTAATLACEVARLGEHFGERDLWALGTTTLGQALLPQGQIDEAMALLDEGLATAVGGELRPNATALVYCWAIASCRDVADVKRAAEWTDVAKRWCERQSIAGFPGVCRIHRAEIMRLRGAWADAERDVEMATEELAVFSPLMAGEAFAELAMVRLRMGDLSGAEAALEHAHELGGELEPAQSLTKLYRDDATGAAACIRDRLSDESLDRLQRGRMLPSAVEIALATGSIVEAQGLAEELEQLADDFGTTLFQAAAKQARGGVEIMQGNPRVALRALERSLRLWQELDAPFEAAQVRVLMGQAYRAVGNEDGAARELRSARVCFDKLGARLDAERTAAALSDAQRTPATPTARVFLFSDVVSSTALLQAIGDEAWRRLVEWHDRTLRALFSEHGGEEVDHAGDGFFVAFLDAKSALHCAVAIQRRLCDHRREHGFSTHVRIGVHAAEALRLGSSYKGRGVHAAARIASIADGDEVLVSKETLTAADSRFDADEPHLVDLKGFPDLVEVCAVRWH